LLLDELLEGFVDTLVKNFTTSSATCRHELYFYLSPMCCNEIFFLKVDRKLILEMHLVFMQAAHA
jgi:hypothetical protein